MEIGGEEDEKEEKKGAKLVRTANDKQIITFSLAVRCATGKEFIRSNIFLFSLFFFSFVISRENKRAICVKVILKHSLYTCCAYGSCSDTHATQLFKSLSPAIE